MIRLISVLSLSVLLLLPNHSTADTDGVRQKAIIVTGASSGIGRNLTEKLAAAGHFVYAGARKDADIAELNKIENVLAVRLDVTKQDQVDAAVDLVRSEGRDLWGLVNNAGIGGGGPVIETPLEEQSYLFSVNVEGVFRVTQAFAPLIIEGRGRIVSTGSIAGILAPEGWSAYSGTKHAVEAFTDALASEMAPFGVTVSVIEPGNYQSNFKRKSAVRRLGIADLSVDDFTEKQQSQYEKVAAWELSLPEPDDVSAAFLHALFSENPLRRYLVVSRKEEAEWTISKAISKVVQLNTWGPHSYSRDELVEMLDIALN